MGEMMGEVTFHFHNGCCAYMPTSFSFTRLRLCAIIIYINSCFVFNPHSTTTTMISVSDAISGELNNDLNEINEKRQIKRKYKPIIQKNETKNKPKKS
jgi:capsular polysaccharide biosynthesis protein